ncbi:BBS5 [Symbiodinium sp. CCMP2456]|nr:BBS5 [Symbiodinium sp. CCMP2456]
MPQLLKLRKGEFQIDSINSVEDTKGNNGERGILIVTNLRLIWTSAKYARTNLSIGFNCVSSVNIRTVNSRLRGNSQALYVMTRFNSTRFEFIFTSLVKHSPRLFTTVQAVFKSYETTKLYRDLKLRGAIIRDKELVMLPNEQVYEKINGIWNLSSDQGNLGTFIITNVRTVWFAVLAENFNVSIPYLQMKSINVRNSKFGQALVIETTASSGGYILGFRADPVEHLEEVYTQIHNLWKIFSVTPIFGVEFSVEDKQSDGKENFVPRQEDDVQIMEGDDIEPCLLYQPDGEKEIDREPIYNNELGLAVERLKEGSTIQQLWQIARLQPGVADPSFTILTEKSRVGSVQVAGC